MLQCALLMMDDGGVAQLAVLSSLELHGLTLWGDDHHILQVHRTARAARHL